MKKLLFSLFLLIVICSSAMCAEQNQNVEDNKAVVVVTKTPANAESNQTQIVRNNWFSVVVICNGKVPFEPNKGNN